MLSQAFKALRLLLDYKYCTSEGYYLIIWCFIVLSLIQYWLSSQPFWVYHSSLSVEDDCLNFCAFSWEMYPFQNAVWTDSLVLEGRAKICCNEKGIINTISLTQTRTCGFIDFRWGKPISEICHRKSISKTIKKSQLLF